MSGEFDVSSDVEFGKASEEVGKQPFPLESIPKDPLAIVSSFLTEVDANALSAVSKTIYDKLLENTSASTANRRARAQDYRLFSHGELPLKNPITLPELTSVNEVKPQFLPVMITLNKNDADSSFSRKKSLLLELLLSHEKAGFNTVNVLMRNLPTMVREIITIEAINYLPDSGEIKYVEAKLYLDIIIANRKTRLPLSALKKLILGIERLSDVPEKYQPLLCQAIVSYIKVFDNSLENNMHSDSVSNDNDIINLFKNYNLDTREITAKVLEDLMVRMLEHKANASADAFIVALKDLDKDVVETAIEEFSAIAKPISENKADAIVDKLISGRELLGRYIISEKRFIVLAEIVPRVSDDKFNKIVDKLILLSKEDSKIAATLWNNISKHKVELTVNASIVALSSSDKATRDKAVDALNVLAVHISEDKADIVANELIALLRTRLPDSNIENVHISAAEILGNIAVHISEDKADTVANELIALLMAKVPNVDIEWALSSAAEILGKIAVHVSENKVNEIADALLMEPHDTYDQFMGYAAEALGKVVVHVSENKVNEIVNVIIAELPDCNDGYMVYAAHVLGEAAVRVSPDKVNEIVDAIIAMLQDFDDEIIVRNAVKALGKIAIAACASSDKVNEIADALITQLRDFDDDEDGGVVKTLSEVAAYVSPDKVDEIADVIIDAIAKMGIDVLEYSNGLYCKTVEALGYIAVRVSPDKADEIADKLIDTLSKTNLCEENAEYVIEALGKVAACVSPKKVDAVMDVLIASLDDDEFTAVIALEALTKKGVVLSEEKTKLLIAKIKGLDKHYREPIIVDLCVYFVNRQTSVDTITLNQLDPPIQHCLLNGENLFYILHYLLNNKKVVTEGVTWLTPEAYGTFISKVITGYQQEPEHNKRQKGASYELNNILQDGSATSQQRMGAVVKHVWQEKNQSVFFGNVQLPSTISMIAKDTLQEMIQSNSAIM